MTKTLNDMIDRVAFRTGKKGVDGSMNTGAEKLIRESIQDAHAFLTEKRIISHDIEEVPEPYVTALARYYANEARQVLDPSRSAQDYEAEQRFAIRAVRAVSSPAPYVAPDPEEPEALRHL